MGPSELPVIFFAQRPIEFLLRLRRSAALCSVQLAHIDRAVLGCGRDDRLFWMQDCLVYHTAMPRKAVKHLPPLRIENVHLAICTAAREEAVVRAEAHSMQRFFRVVRGSSKLIELAMSGTERPNIPQSHSVVHAVRQQEIAVMAHINPRNRVSMACAESITDKASRPTQKSAELANY